VVKLLINIFIFYAIWQIIKMFFSVKKVQDQFQQQVNDLHQKVNRQQTPPKQQAKEKKNEVDGEYIDYEEIK
jgi:predicted Holliday junction resolvase-like endonuclease